MNKGGVFKLESGKLSDSIRDGVPISKVAKTYSAIAREYEETIIATKVYKGPDLTANVFRDHWPDDKPKSARILDVGGGTGPVAEVLKQMGFEHIDCLDPSEGMMDVAREKKVYDKYYQEFLGEENCTISTDTYGGVVSTGSLGPSHVPCSGVADIVRLCQPGAIACLGFRAEHLKAKTDFGQNWNKTIESLRRDGFIEVLQKIQETEEWHDHLKGYIIAFRVLKSGGVIHHN